MSNPASQHPNADVRMRGFAERISVQQALAWLDSKLAEFGNLKSETVPLHAAAGRVLAGNVVSRFDVPRFQRAMMDGYALRAADIHDASDANPIELEVIGECFPGQRFVGELGKGQAVRIMTGAPLPSGVDAVLPVEHTTSVDQRVMARKSLPSGKNLGCVGEDVHQGDVVLSSGRVLRPQDLGMLSSIGCGEVLVVRHPRVNIVITGDELLPAGAEPGGTQIVDANGPMLAALVGRDCGLAEPYGIVRDDRESILEALDAPADIVLTSGGSSVGQEDHVPTLLAEHGELAVHGVAMRPAGPVGMGTYNGRLVFLLPGNPVACLWGYDLFAGRAIRRIGGRNADWPYRKTLATLQSELCSPAGRLDYVRVTVSESKVAPVAMTGASVLSSTTRADGFLVIPSDVTGYPVGAQVEVFLYD